MPQTKTPQRAPQAPVKTYRAGSVRASIWANETQQDNRTVVQYSIRLNRRYRKQDGTWETTEVFFPDHLLAAAHLAKKAFDFVGVDEQTSEDDARPV